MRLNKYLSSAGVASRRAADTLIQQGRVEVNGRVVDALGSQVDPGRDEVRVDGRRVNTAAPLRRYLLMNKPRGVISTRSDPQRRTTVVDVLAAAGIRGYFYPVGRLDHDSEGLIILTNDGAFAERVMHPRHELERAYEVEVEGVPDERDLDRLRRGVVIDGQRTLPASVRVLKTRTAGRTPRAVLELTLREGRNRQVRRMCDAIAHPVERLRRTRIGPIADRRLAPGQVRDLTLAEVRTLLKSSPEPAATAAPAAKYRQGRRGARSRGARAPV